MMALKRWSLSLAFTSSASAGFRSQSRIAVSDATCVPLEQKREALGRGTLDQLPLIRLAVQSFRDNGVSNPRASARTHDRPEGAAARQAIESATRAQGLY
jgi:hypothetical protein